MGSDKTPDGASHGPAVYPWEVPLDVLWVPCNKSMACTVGTLESPPGGPKGFPIGRSILMGSRAEFPSENTVLVP